MKTDSRLLLHNILAVLRRNRSIIMKLGINLGIWFLINRLELNYPFFWVLQILFLIDLVSALFLLVIDLLDTVFDVPGLSSFRKRIYDNKINRIKARVKNSQNYKKKILMPYQMSNGMSMPGVMIYDISKLQGKD